MANSLSGTVGGLRTSFDTAHFKFFIAMSKHQSYAHDPLMHRAPLHVLRVPPSLSNNFVSPCPYILQSMKKLTPPTANSFVAAKFKSTVISVRAPDVHSQPLQRAHLPILPRVSSITTLIPSTPTLFHYSMVLSSVRQTVQKEPDNSIPSSRVSFLARPL